MGRERGFQAKHAIACWRGFGLGFTTAHSCCASLCSKLRSDAWLIISSQGRSGNPDCCFACFEVFSATDLIMGNILRMPLPDYTIRFETNPTHSPKPEQSSRNSMSSEMRSGWSEHRRPKAPNLSITPLCFTLRMGHLRVSCFPTRASHAKGTDRASSSPVSRV